MVQRRKMSSSPRDMMLGIIAIFVWFAVYLVMCDNASYCLHVGIPRSGLLMVVRPWHANASVFSGRFSGEDF